MRVLEFQRFHQSRRASSCSSAGPPRTCITKEAEIGELGLLRSRTTEDYAPGDCRTLGWSSKVDIADFYKVGPTTGEGPKTSQLDRGKLEVIMPHFQMLTNLAENKIPSDLTKKICEVTSKSLGKPLSHCSAAIVGGINLSWGGSNEPAAQTSLVSIGALGVEENKRHSKALFDLIQKELSIAPDRMFINFIDAAPGNIGYNGTTCYDIFNK